MTREKGKGEDKPASIKQAWADIRKQAFTGDLMDRGWKYVGLDKHKAEIYQFDRTRLVVDDYGLFVLENDGFGNWIRVLGLADDSIKVKRSAIGPLYEEGDEEKGSSFINLNTGIRTVVPVPARVKLKEIPSDAG